MPIRAAEFDDVNAILEISNAAALKTAANFAVEPETLEYWRAAWQSEHDRYPWFLAVDGETVTGFAKASPWKGRCAYTYSAEVTVYVHPDHQRRGIGRGLYETLIPDLETRGMRTLLAGITLPNPASVALHESFGFVQTALFPRIGWKFDRWHDVGYWVLHLGGDGPPAEAG